MTSHLGVNGWFKEPYITSIEQFKQAAEKYLSEHIHSPQDAPVLEEFAQELGYCNLAKLDGFIKEHNEYQEAYLYVKKKVEIARHKLLVNPEMRNINGLVFDLINNHGWHQKQDMNIGGQLDNKLEISVNFTNKTDNVPDKKD
jgi:hypothetical protein